MDHASTIVFLSDEDTPELAPGYFIEEERRQARLAFREGLAADRRDAYAQLPVDGLKRNAAWIGPELTATLSPRERAGRISG